MNESFQKNKKGIFLMICSSICVCIGQLLWKLSNQYGFLYLIAGFAFYGLGALIMLIAYRYGSLSVLQPVLSINYILSLLLGNLILNEAVTVNKLIGILVIIAGVVLISGGDS